MLQAEEHKCVVYKTLHLQLGYLLEGKVLENFQIQQAPTLISVVGLKILKVLYTMS